MTSYFYQIIDEAVMYGWEDQQAEYYALKLTDMRCWCEELLDLSGIPESPFRTSFLQEMFDWSSDEPHELWQYIQDRCAPEEEEEVHESTAALD